MYSTEKDTNQTTKEHQDANLYDESMNQLESRITELLATSTKGKKSVSDALVSFLTNIKEEYGHSVLEEVTNKLSETDKNEPILNPENRRFTVFPIQYPSIWDEYHKQFACFWRAEEIDFSGDYDDFKTLNKDEQHFIKMIIAFFAASDGIVNMNLGERFSREIQIMEAQIAYNYQMMMEDIHGKVYSLMLENIIRDPKERDFMFNAIENVSSIKLMADWAFKWIDSSESFGHRVIAFAIVEAVFFSGAFASIFWLKKYKSKNSGSSSKQFMNGLIQSNKFIARDEGQHASFACEIYKLLNHKISATEVNAMIVDAVGISKNFMTDALPVRLIGMNNDMMCDYIEYVGDRLLSMLGYKKLYNKKNPFGFMETIGLNDKSNLHEVRPTEYQDANTMNKNKGPKQVVIDDDF